MVCVCAIFPTLRKMLKHGLDVVEDEETGQATNYPVEIVLVGDMEFLSMSLGHQGSAATYPILYDLTTSAHLRTAHLDGSPHTPATEGCVFAHRSLESMLRDFNSNLMDTRNGRNRRKNGKYHHSMVDPPLVPIRTILDVAAALLHILLGLGGMTVKWVTIWTRILDGTATEKELKTLAAEVEAELKELERKDEGEEEGERGEDDSEEEEEEEVEDEGGLMMQADVLEKVRTAAEEELRRRKLEVEAAWIEEAIKMEELEEEEKELGKEIEDRVFLMRRIEVAETGDRAALTKEVQKRNKVKYKDWDFRPCSAQCIATHYELTVATSPCSQCATDCHDMCEVEEEQDEEALESGEVMEGGGELLGGGEAMESDEVLGGGDVVEQGVFVCRRCRGTATFKEMREQVQVQVENRRTRGRRLREEQSRVSLLVAARRKDVVAIMGQKEKQLNDILENEVKVRKTDYASCSYVGNDVKKIFMEHEKVIALINLLFVYSC